MDSSANNGPDRRGDGPQPASGPTDRATARWYAEHTGGQFQAFERDGVWFLFTPEPAKP